MNRIYLLPIATLVLLFLVTVSADAGCCDRCGATCPTQLVCRTICVSEIVESGCWDEQCETICQPPKSLSAAGCLAGCCDSCGADAGCDAGIACDAAGGACDDCLGCGEGSSPLLSNWLMLLSHLNRGHMRDRKRLVWKSSIEYVPRLECVVEQLCGSCCVAMPSSMAGDRLASPADPTSCAEDNSPPMRWQVSDQPSQLPSAWPDSRDADGLSQDPLTLAPSTGPPVLLQVSDQVTDESASSTGLPTALVEAGELPDLEGGHSIAPVRLQISDQSPDLSDSMPLLLPADAQAEDLPTSVSALAPLAPVVHSLSR